MVDELDVFAILPTSFGKSLIFKPFPQVMSPVNGRSRRCLHDQGSLFSSRGHNERPSLTAEIGVAETTWHVRICRSVFSMLTFPFAAFNTSVICHVVFRFYLGSFLSFARFVLKSLSIAFLGTRFELFSEPVSK